MLPVRRFESEDRRRLRQSEAVGVRLNFEFDRGARPPGAAIGLKRKGTAFHADRNVLACALKNSRVRKVLAELEAFPELPSL